MGLVLKAIIQILISYLQKRLMWKAEEEGHHFWIGVSWPGEGVYVCAGEMIPYKKKCYY